MQRLVLLMTVLLGLTGCISSKEELITAEISAMPIADGSRFTAVDPSEKDKGKSGYVIVRRIGDSYFLLVEKDGLIHAYMRGRLTEIAPDTFLGMFRFTGTGTEAKDEKVIWGYGLLVREGTSYIEFVPSCDDLKKAVEAAGKTISDFGVMGDGHSSCDFGSLNDVTTAMLFLLGSGMKPQTRFDPTS